MMSIYICIFYASSRIYTVSLYSNLERICALPRIELLNVNSPIYIERRFSTNQKKKKTPMKFNSIPPVIRHRTRSLHNNIQLHSPICVCCGERKLTYRQKVCIHKKKNHIEFILFLCKSIGWWHHTHTHSIFLWVWARACAWKGRNVRGKKKPYGIKGCDDVAVVVVSWCMLRWICSIFSLPPTTHTERERNAIVGNVMKEI